MSGNNYGLIPCIKSQGSFNNYVFKIFINDLLFPINSF